MKITFKRILSSLLCVCIILPAGVFGAGAVQTAAPAAHDYTIINPYKDVNWNTWKQYKAALHTHTIASDGASNLDEMVESHYALGFDILAITDHMITNKGWNVMPQLVPLMTAAKKERNAGRTVVPLTDARYREILTGADRGGRGMLDVPFGVELNGAVPRDTHVNGLFVNYGQGLLGVSGDYETPVRENGKLGGITFLNHIGNFTEAWDKRDPGISKDPKYVNKFARIFLDYPSCIAMDINSGEDAHTPYDRILWDEVLQKTIPNGRNVSCITFSDSHGVDQNNRAFTLMMEPENTAAALRTCLETGAYFGVSTHARYELGDEFNGTGPTPAVTKVDIDQSGDSITLTGINYDKITWVSNGNIIANGETISLDTCNDLGCYVRAYMTGPGGICYTQAFIITAPDIKWDVPSVPKITIDYSQILRALVTVLDKLLFSRSIAVKLFKHFALGI